MLQLIYFTLLSYRVSFINRKKSKARKLNVLFLISFVDGYSKRDPGYKQDEDRASTTD